MEIGNRLAECENVIERGLATFVEVGKALAEIRDSGLYKVGHDTFEDYVKIRWGRNRNWAYQLIDASVVIENVSHAIQTPPANARQAVELARAPKEKQAEVWAEVVAEGEPTAAKVKAAVQKYCPPKETSVPKVRVKATLQAIDDLEQRLERCGVLSDAQPLLDSLRKLLDA